MAANENNLRPEQRRDADAPTTEQKPGRPATAGEARLMGWGLIILALILAYLFLVFWPSGMNPKSSGGSNETIYLVHLFGKTYYSFPATLDVRILLMVMMAGALGSFIHAATSFGDFVGNEKLTVNWMWWYVMRPFVGMALAAIFYLVIRSGFLSAGSDTVNVNPYSVAAIAGLVGMFSKQATDKLGEVFDTLFKTTAGTGDAKRKDALNNPVPVLNDIEPKTVEPMTKNVVVTVKGSGFVKGSVVHVGGVARETEFKDAFQLTAKLVPEDVAAEGEVNLTVFNPGPGGGESTPIKFKIAAGGV